MSYAITRCPGCSTSFRVTGEQLRLADGDVRCGACLTVFQAESYLVVPLLDATERMAIQAEYWTDFNTWLSGMGEEPSAALNKEPSAGFDEEPSAALNKEPSAGFDEEPSAAFNKEPSAVFNEEPSPDSDTTPPAPSHVASAADEKPGSVYSDVPVFESAEPVDAVPLLTHGDPVTGEAAPVAVSVTDTAAAVLDPDELPALDALDMQIEADPAELLMDQRRHFSFRWVRWVPGILVMGCFLGLQFAWFNMDSLSQYPAYRNLYLQVCDYLGCRVTDFSDPGQLQTKNLVIRSHPDESDALIVDVLLRNSAAYPQRFPGLRLRFYDVRGGVVASRVFEVSEYLGGELRGLKYIPARTEVRLALELVDPGEQAMGYEMDVIAGSPTG